mmetsp:Transcript_31512/g.71185  ORF Transcript_31512/g.71185 Transcript_31512/m.71185 type:complete len:138 (-) Transcript_31512:98-511(-)
MEMEEEALQEMEEVVEVEVEQELEVELEVEEVLQEVEVEEEEAAEENMEVEAAGEMEVAAEMATCASIPCPSIMCPTSRGSERASSPALRPRSGQTAYSQGVRTRPPPASAWRTIPQTWRRSRPRRSASQRSCRRRP